MMAILVLQGCKKNRHKDLFYDIKISTSIGNLSKVATNNDGSQYFENNDEISVYAWVGDKTVAPSAGERVVNNSINRLNNGVWTASPQMLWNTTTDPHNFIGIYPKTDTPVDNLAADIYRTNENEPVLNDLLVATNYDGLTGDMKSKVPLMFDHVMAKVIVNLEFRNQWGEEHKTSFGYEVSKKSKAKQKNEKSVFCVELNHLMEYLQMIDYGR